MVGARKAIWPQNFAPTTILGKNSKGGSQARFSFWRVEERTVSLCSWLVEGTGGKGSSAGPAAR